MCGILSLSLWWMMVLWTLLLIATATKRAQEKQKILIRRRRRRSVAGARRRWLLSRPWLPNLSANGFTWIGNWLPMISILECTRLWWWGEKTRLSLNCILIPSSVMASCLLPSLWSELMEMGSVFLFFYTGSTCWVFNAFVMVLEWHVLNKFLNCFFFLINAFIKRQISLAC